MEKYIQYDPHDQQPISRDPFKKPTIDPQKNEQNNNINECNIYENELKTRNKNSIPLKSSVKNEGDDLISVKTSVNKAQNSNYENESIEGNENNQSVTKKKKRGIFGKVFHAVGDFFHEVQYLWKKEELVECLDAHGNIVKRPKKKIPLKTHVSQKDPESKKVDQVAEENICDNAKQGINYGYFFN